MTERFHQEDDALVIEPGASVLSTQEWLLINSKEFMETAPVWKCL